MKKGILAMLILFSFAAFAEKTHEKTAKLEKDAYCKAPKSHGDYKKINDKDSRVDIDFENCVFDGENYENAKVGILIQDKDKFENFLKKYKIKFQMGGNDYGKSYKRYEYNGSCGKISNYCASIDEIWAWMCWMYYFECGNFR